MKTFAEDLASQGGAMPGEFPERDRAAWKRLQLRVGRCQCETRGEDPGYSCPVDAWMLMHHEPDGTAAFKHRETRRYLRT